MRRLSIVVLAGLLLAGCSSAPQMVKVPDVTSMAGDDARDAIEAAGFESEFDAGDESVWMASNWTVMSQKPVAGSKAEDGTTVTLVVGKPQSEPEPEASPDPTPTAEANTPALPSEEATSAGLTKGTARSTCDLAGKVSFPYGYDPHWIMGRLAEEIVNDQWFFKVEVSITNEYDADRDVVIECTIGGDEAAPTLLQYDAH